VKEVQRPQVGFTAKLVGVVPNRGFQFRGIDEACSHFAHRFQRHIASALRANDFVIAHKREQRHHIPAQGQFFGLADHFGIMVLLQPCAETPFSGLDFARSSSLQSFPPRLMPTTLGRKCCASYVVALSSSS
jgi:hypothetical protein